MADTKHTLYANQTQTRFYWIPDSATLPAGTYVLRSLTGSRIEVDESAALPYKITEDRAKELTREVLAKVTQQAGNFLSGLGALMQEVARKQATPRENAAPDEASEATGEKEKDADAVLDGLREIWEDLQAGAKEAADHGRVADAAARERIKKMAEQAGSNLDAAEAAVEEFRGKVVDFLQSPEVKQKIDEATKRIKELADELGKSVQGTRADRTATGENRPVEE